MGCRVRAFLQTKPDRRRGARKLRPVRARHRPEEILTPPFFPPFLHSSGNRQLEPRGGGDIGRGPPAPPYRPLSPVSPLSSGRTLRAPASLGACPVRLELPESPATPPPDRGPVVLAHGPGRGTSTGRPADTGQHLDGVEFRRQFQPEEIADAHGNEHWNNSHANPPESLPVDRVGGWGGCDPRSPLQHNRLNQDHRPGEH